MLCIPKDKIEAFKKALKDQEIKVADLINMTTEARTALLEKFAGESAKTVNTLFEEKLILKNRVQGIKNWISKVGEVGRYDPAKKAKLEQALSEYRARQQERIFSPKENEAFLADLVEETFGTKISKVEAKNIFDLTRQADELKVKMESGERRTKNGRATESEMEYGRKVIDLQDYTDFLKEEKGITWKDFKKQSIKEKATTVGGRILQGVKNIPGTAKSLKSTFDNSFIGNQGVKLLLKGIGELTTAGFKKTPGKFGIEFGGFQNGRLWLKGFGKSFQNIWNTFGGKDVMREIRAEIISDPQIDLLKKMKVAVGTVEEAFPSIGLEKGLEWLGGKIEKTKIPVASKVAGRVVGKTLKAADNAFTGTAYYLRYKLAKLQLDVYEKMGLDLTNTNLLEGIGKQVNSLTARGNTGGNQGTNGLVNNVIWSPKMIKGNIDVLTAHLFDPKVPKQVKIVSLTNLLRIIAGVAVIQEVSNLVSPGSVERDPRSSDFQKIKKGDRRIGYTGGAATIITLISRIIPTLHNGEWGLWTKSSTTGEFTKLNSGNWASQTGLNVFYNFLENKTAPVASMLINYLKGEDRQGKPVTVKGEATNLFTPLQLNNAIQTLSPENQEDIAMKIIGLITEFVGFNGNLYSASSIDWNQDLGVELAQFKEKIGEEKFKEANDEYNKRVSEVIAGLDSNTKYQGYTDEEKAIALKNKKAEIKAKIIDEYAGVFWKYKEKKEPLGYKKPKI